MKSNSPSLLKLLALSLAALLIGCTAKYDRVTTGGTETNNVSLDRTQTVYVAIPADGQYQSKTYQGSGKYVSRQVAAAFSKHAKRVIAAGGGYQRPEDAYVQAEKAGARYVVVPTIAHWEHRATAWSGLPSRASIGINVRDLKSGQEVASTLIEGRSRILSWTETSPESLIPEPVTEYVGTLYSVN